LVNPLEAEDGFEAAIIDALRSLASDRWLLVSTAFPVESEQLVLFAACDPGWDLELIQAGDYAGIGQGIPWPVIPGIYCVEYCDLRVPTKPFGSPTVICRFRPIQIVAAGLRPAVVRRCPPPAGRGITWPPRTRNATSHDDRSRTRPRARRYLCGGHSE